jgi:CheY-like chemotaxis protein
MKALLEVWHQLEEVREAANGSEAVQLVEDFRPDVILMDARMPKMSGLEATRLIKAKWPQIKIIVLSVFMDYQALALAAGADAFVSKSDPPEVLRKTLVNVMGDRNRWIGVKFFYSTQQPAYSGRSCSSQVVWSCGGPPGCRSSRVLKANRLIHIIHFQEEP